ncbi:YhgE/Pip domain-containing protein [Peptacetobacter hiranonis]|uniref:YhgE/Pip domain-containing protein n=1 Tax=Peptacetobacter hiranonis TaxID=89152 RepID=UPI0022E3AFD3|nr:YhgE/Pip domain-containing protein [Peptacetobacter hiranonis]
MFKEEWKSIFKNKFLIVVLIAVAFIPALYNIIFLSSMWDPYGKVDNLPVAVVNHDKPVEYEGKTLKVGDELVDNLKEDKSMDFHFVSENDANDGIKDGKYYMVVTIPENFSKNASTLISDNPKKVTIDYQTTEGRNFIAAKMSKTAITEMKTQLSSQITDMYVTAALEQFEKVGEGMTTAADGSGKLKDGNDKIIEGNKTITTNLDKLAKSSITFANGAETLSVGLDQYVAGAVELNNGANQLNNGIQTLAKKVPVLAQGVEALSNGATKLGNGVMQFVAGITQLDNGAKQLNSGLNQLDEKTANLPAQTAELNNGAQQLASGLQSAGSMSEAQKNGMISYVNSVNAYLDQVNNALNNLPSSTKTGDISGVKKSLESIGKDLAIIQNGLDNSSGGSSNSGASSSDIKAAYNSDTDAHAEAAVSAAESSGVELTEEQKSAIRSAVKNSGGETLSEASNISSGTSNSGSVDSSVTDALKNAQRNLNAVSEGLGALNGSSSNSLTGLSELQKTTKQLKARSDTATPGIISSINGLYTIGASAAPGSEKLANGTSQLATNMPVLSSSIKALSNGSAQLVNGTGQLAANAPLLNSGAQQVANGGKELSAAVPTLSSGISRLSSGSAALAGGTSKLAANGPKLTSGAGQLKNGALRISSGSGQLAAGSNKLDNALHQVKDGLVTLTDSLKSGADKIKDTNTGDSAANAIARPVKTSHTDVDKVPNNGTAMAPYMLSVALFIAPITINMLYDTFNPKKKPSSGIAWWASKMSVLGLVAVLSASIVFFALTGLLGLKPLYPAKTLAFLMLTSLTFTSLVTLFNLLLGKIGAFLMLIFMILQLGGSAGTYAIQLSNDFFMGISPYLPMTYTVSGLRQLISIRGDVTVQVAVLVGILIVTNLLMILFFHMKKKSYPTKVFDGNVLADEK